MKSFVLRLSLLALLLASAHGATAPAATRQLFTCGRERVHLIDLDVRDASGAPRKLWTWQAAGRADLPSEYHALFRSTDECKPIDGGRRVLITSSGGAVALVDREKDAVIFYGRAVNAHSADVLPNGRVAVASSRDPREGRGDSLILFDLASPGRELWRTELPSGHGVVWDEARRTLWALSDKDIRSYTLAGWETDAPRLTRVGLFPLPENGGHELFPVPGTMFLAVSTNRHCWFFHRDTHALTPHSTLADKANIKCIDQHPVTGQIAIVQGEAPNWWSERIQLFAPAGSASLPGEQFYKVRWNLPAERHR